MKNHSNNEIWLINDRSNKAGDNGEYFFRFLKKKNPNDIKYYFVISDKCNDYVRLKDFGNILILGSKNYNLTFLKADKLISSSSNSWVHNPFGENRKYLIDLYHFDFIFLQHGISKDDLSNYLNKYLKNYSIIITASKYEYQSFLSNDLGYTTKNIKLTGFSRFDNYQNNKITQNLENIILLMPTWRINIVGTVKPVTYESIHSNNFINTEYFKFYNNLINSPRLLETMKNYNYKGIFALHPTFSEQWCDFNNNSLFTIMNNFDYQKLLIKSSLLITDYSSIFFDFAFMEKPVIYTQFDYEQYRNNHYKKGYFDYILNGFGPICRDIESCIDIIINQIKNDNKIKQKYLKRIRSFFAFFDNSNNERIYHAIKNLNNVDVKNEFEKIIINILILSILFFNILVKVLYKLYKKNFIKNFIKCKKFNFY